MEQRRLVGIARTCPDTSSDLHNVAPNTDTDGEELPDDEAAWQEATTYAGALFKDIDGKFRPGQEWSFEVTDEAGKSIYKIQISAKNET